MFVRKAGSRGKCLPLVVKFRPVPNPLADFFLPSRPIFGTWAGYLEHPLPACAGSRPALPTHRVNPQPQHLFTSPNDKNSICVAICRRTDQFRQRHGPRSRQQRRPKTSARPSHFFSLTLSDDQDDLIRRGRWGVGKRHAGLDATRRQSPATSTRFFYELN